MVTTELVSFLFAVLLLTVQAFPLSCHDCVTESEGANGGLEAPKCDTIEVVTINDRTRWQ